MMVTVYGGRSRLQFFLEGCKCKVLGCGGEVTGFEIRRELSEILRDRAAALRRRTRSRLTLQLLQRGEVGLCRRQVAGLQVLSELLKLRMHLLHAALEKLRTDSEHSAANRCRGEVGKPCRLARDFLRDAIGKDVSGLARACGW